MCLKCLTKVELPSPFSTATIRFNSEILPYVKISWEWRYLCTHHSDNVTFSYLKKYLETKWRSCRHCWRLLTHSSTSVLRVSRTITFLCLHLQLFAARPHVFKNLHVFLFYMLFTHFVIRYYICEFSQLDLCSSSWLFELLCSVRSQNYIIHSLVDSCFISSFPHYKQCCSEQLVSFHTHRFLHDWYLQAES